MLLYCSECNNLVDKIIDEICKEGELIERKCQRCGKKLHYFVQYKPVIDKNYAELTDKR